MLAVAFSPLPAARSQSTSGPRSYYGEWKRHSSGYSYRPYCFKPSSDYHGYRHHDMMQSGNTYYY